MTDQPITKERVEELTEKVYHLQSMNMNLALYDGDSFDWQDQEDVLAVLRDYQARQGEKAEALRGGDGEVPASQPAEFPYAEPANYCLEGKASHVSQPVCQRCGGRGSITYWDTGGSHEMPCLCSASRPAPATAEDERALELMNFLVARHGSGIHQDALRHLRRRLSAPTVTVTREWMYIFAEHLVHNNWDEGIAMLKEKGIEVAGD